MFLLCMAHAFEDGNKRTAWIASVNFLRANNLILQYPIDKKKKYSALADLVEACADNKKTIDQMKDWFDYHKSYMP